MPSDLPFGLERVRHLERGSESPWPRRVTLLLLAAFCVAALLDVFGQRDAVQTANASAASLTVRSPSHLRGGLVFSSEIVVSAHRKLNDAQVQFSRDWVRGMTFNGIVPQPSNQSSSADGVTFDFGSLDAGETMPIWISWQVNPTTIGVRAEGVSVSDGRDQLVSIQRQRWVFP